jgi:hypothetical protein
MDYTMTKAVTTTYNTADDIKLVVLEPVTGNILKNAMESFAANNSINPGIGIEVAPNIYKRYCADQNIAEAWVSMIHNILTLSNVTPVSVVITDETYTYTV